MWWIVSLLLMGVFGDALAQDNPGGSEQVEVENARRASDQAIVRFNTDIEDFPSWELFEAVVLARVTPGMLGTCYTYQGGMVRITMCSGCVSIGAIVGASVMCGIGAVSLTGSPGSTRGKRWRP